MGIRKRSIANASELVDLVQRSFTTQPRRGSKTGANGGGRSDARFVSESGRIVIESNDWNVAYATSFAGITPVPDKFTVNWKVEPRFLDEFVSPGVKGPVLETSATLAQGLPNMKHTLKIIIGGDATPIVAIRVYRPALGFNQP